MLFAAPDVLPHGFEALPAALMGDREGECAISRCGRGVARAQAVPADRPRIEADLLAPIF